MRVLLAVVCVTVAHALMKASAPLVLGSRQLWPPLARVAALTAPVLLSALVVTEVGKGGLRDVDPSVAAGLCGAAIAALRLSHGILVPVVTGVAVTGLVRVFIT